MTTKLKPEVKECIRFLKKLKVAKKLNPRHCAYGYKHMVEDPGRLLSLRGGNYNTTNTSFGYISTEDFLEAVAHLRFPSKYEGSELKLYATESSVKEALLSLASERAGGLCKLLKIA